MFIRGTLLSPIRYHNRGVGEAVGDIVVSFPAPEETRLPHLKRSVAAIHSRLVFRPESTTPRFTWLYQVQLDGTPPIGIARGL